MTSPQRASPPLTPLMLQELEEEAWAATDLCHRYATSHHPGFPWFTVVTEAGTARREVIPYDYSFQVFAKGRWVGKSMVSVYTDELSHHPRSYYQQCLREGRLYCIKKDVLRQQQKQHNILRRQLKRAVGEEMPAVSSSSTLDTTEGDASLKADGIDAVLEHGDLVVHRVHRHEIPVMMGSTGVEPIQLLSVRIRDYGILCVNKPTGIPTHATGRYFFNSMLAMMEYVLAPRRIRAWLVEGDVLLQSLISTATLSDVEIDELLHYYTEGTTEDEVTARLDRLPRPCFRLDKPTSGVLLLGVSQQATMKVSAAIMEKSRTQIQWATDTFVREVGLPTHVRRTVQSRYKIRKRYLAQVLGHFPTSSPRLVALAGRDFSEGAAWVDPADMEALNRGSALTSRLSAEPSILLFSPLRTLSKEKTRQCSSDASSSSAVTLVQCLAHTPDASLLQCVPFTGRLHQIRLHLQDWGYQIIGDVPSTPAPRTTSNAKEEVFYDPMTLPASYRKRFIPERVDGEASTSDVEPHCYECARCLPIAVLDEDSGGPSAIHLHAWRYELTHHALIGVYEPAPSSSGEPSLTSDVVVFEAPLPAWVDVGILAASPS